MAKMTQEQKNDAEAMLYLKERNITKIEQVSKKDREVIFKLLDR